MNTGFPAVFLQQQMEEAYFQRYNKMQMMHKSFSTNEHDYTEDIDTQLKPLPEIIDQDTIFVDHQYGLEL